MENLAQNLHNTIIPESVCLGLHLFCAIALIAYLYANRQKTPIIQNSPVLTIVAQIMLVCSSLCLFWGKFLFLQYKGSKSDLVGRGCYVDENDSKAAIANSLYTFFIEFMYMSYLFKMIRVLFISFRQRKLERWECLFNSEVKLIIGAVVWGGIIMLADIFMKIYMYQQHQYRLHVYPQFNQFLCDMPYKRQYSTYLTIIYNIKLAICLSLFVWSFYYSYRLQQIDNDLRLRKQYFILLFLPFSVMITDNILKIVDPAINTAMPVHYVDCLSNLLAGFLLMWLHFNVAKETDFSLPDQNDLSDDFNVDADDLHYIFDKEQIREAIKGYFQYMGRERVFKIQLKMLKPSYNHFENTREKAEQILTCLNRGQASEVVLNTNKMFEAAKSKVDKIVRNLLKEWKSTVSGQAVLQKLKKNGKYFRKMQRLNLVKPTTTISNRSQFNSETEVIYSTR